MHRETVAMATVGIDEPGENTGEKKWAVWKLFQLVLW